MLLGLCACAGLRLKHVEPPQLGLGLEPEELAVEEPSAPAAEPPAPTAGPPTASAEREPAAEVAALPADVLAEEAAHELEPPEQTVSDPEPAPVRAGPSSFPALLAQGCELVGSMLVDPGGVALARVEDLTIDPPSGQVIGVLVASDAAGEGQGPQVICQSFAGFELGRIPLDKVEADELSFALRELETAELFRHRELETIEGTVDGVPGEFEDDGITSVTLVDDNNHRHRVLLGPPNVIGPAPLENGTRAKVLALSIRDDTGPFAVAARLTIGEFELILRDDQGRTTWGAIVEPPRGWRFVEDLRGRAIRIDGETLPVGRMAELEIRIADAGVESAWFESGNGPVRIPWEALRRGEGGWFVVSRTDWQAAARKGARDAAEDDAPR
jgi:hypothetical protein